MYAKYVYNPNATETNILNDIGLLLTGTTDKNLLSSDCDKANSDIIATDAAGWTEVTAQSKILPTAASIQMMRFAQNGTTIVATTYMGSGTTFVMTSVDNGATFTPVSVTTSYYWGNVIYSTTCALFFLFNVSGAYNTYFTSPDGLTWTSRTFPASITLNNSQNSHVDFGGLFLVFTSTTTYYSTTNGIAWTSQTAPFSVMYTTVLGGVLYAIPNTASTSFAYTANGTSWTSGSKTSATPVSLFNDGTNLYYTQNGSTSYMSSNLGVTWVSMGTAPTHNVATWYSGAFLLISWSTTSTLYLGTNFTTISSSIYASISNTYCNYSYAYFSIINSKLYISGTSATYAYNSPTVGYLNKTFRAVCNNGTTYKYINIDLSTSGYFFIKVAETFNGDVTTNLCYNSNVTTYCGAISVSSGGVIRLFVSVRKCLSYTYTNINATYSGIFGCVEISGDDPWYTTFPPFGFFNPTVGLYTPRLKTGVSTYVTDSSALLSQTSNFSLTKQILNADNSVANAVQELAYSNVSLTYAVLGGKLLGNIYRTTDSLGYYNFEMTVDSKTYVIHANGTSRLLLPKY